MFSRDLRPVRRPAPDGHLLLERPFHRRREAGAIEPVELVGGPADASGPARAAAQAWWAFLDEREASKGLGAAPSNPNSPQKDR